MFDKKVKFLKWLKNNWSCLLSDKAKMSNGCLCAYKHEHLEHKNFFLKFSTFLIKILEAKF